MSVLIQIPTRMPAATAVAVPGYHAGLDLALDAAHIAARDTILHRERDPLWQAFAYFDPI